MDDEQLKMKQNDNEQLLSRSEFEKRRYELANRIALKKIKGDTQGLADLEDELNFIDHVKEGIRPQLQKLKEDEQLVVEPTYRIPYRSFSSVGSTIQNKQNKADPNLVIQPKGETFTDIKKRADRFEEEEKERKFSNVRDQLLNYSEEKAKRDRAQMYEPEQYIKNRVHMPNVKLDSKTISQFPNEIYPDQYQDLLSDEKSNYVWDDNQMMYVLKNLNTLP